MNLSWKERFVVALRWKLKHSLKFSDERSKYYSFLSYWILSFKLNYFLHKNRDSKLLHNHGCISLKETMDQNSLEKIQHIFSDPKQSAQEWDFFSMNGSLIKPEEVNNNWSMAIHNHTLNLLGDDFVLDIAETIFGKTLKSYYSSNYRILNVKCYITKPLDGEKPNNSFLWHIDNHPPGLIKGFVYLTDTGIKNGAFSCIPTSHKTNHSKYQNKNEKAEFRFTESYIESLNLPSLLVTGKAGTSFLANANCLHRATPVQEGHRTILVFMFLPSIMPVEKHLKNFPPLGNKDVPDRIHEPLWNWK